MMNEGDSARRFTRLIVDALRDPETVDKSALLIAASAFLDAFKDGDDERAPFLRRMAFKAMDWCVFEYPEYYEELRVEARACSMVFKLKTIADKIG